MNNAPNMPKAKSRSKQKENQCRKMRHDVVGFPNDVPFKSKLLNEIVQYHCRGKANVRTGRFEWRIGFHGNRDLYFERTKNVWDSISWKNSAQRCDSGIKKTSDCVEQQASSGDRTAAMRHKVFNPKRLAYVKEKGAYQKPGSNNWFIPECPHCGRKDIPFDVDHKTLMFCEIKTQFLNKYGLNIDDIKVEKKETAWFMSDEQQALSWQQYHDGLVDYQILCRGCHIGKTKQDLLKFKKK